MTESDSGQLAEAIRTQGQEALAGWSYKRSSLDRVELGGGQLAIATRTQGQEALVGWSYKRSSVDRTELGSIVTRTPGQEALAGWSYKRSIIDRTGNAIRQPLSLKKAGGSCERSNLDQSDISVAPAPGLGGILTKSSATGPVAKNI
jgi:hypothetical protein